MEKKSFLKGLFTGLGIGLVGFIVACVAIGCSSGNAKKPQNVTTVPVVNRFDLKPKNLPLDITFCLDGYEYTVPDGSTWQGVSIDGLVCQNGSVLFKGKSVFEYSGNSQVSQTPSSVIGSGGWYFSTPASSDYKVTIGVTEMLGRSDGFVFYGPVNLSSSSYYNKTGRVYYGNNQSYYFTSFSVGYYWDQCKLPVLYFKNGSTVGCQFMPNGSFSSAVSAGGSRYSLSTARIEWTNGFGTTGVAEEQYCKAFNYYFDIPLTEHDLTVNASNCSYTGNTEDLEGGTTLTFTADENYYFPLSIDDLDYSTSNCYINGYSLIGGGSTGSQCSVMVGDFSGDGTLTISALPKAYLNVIPSNCTVSGGRYSADGNWLLFLNPAEGYHFPDTYGEALTSGCIPNSGWYSVNAYSLSSLDGSVTLSFSRNFVPDSYDFPVNAIQDHWYSVDFQANDYDYSVADDYWGGINKRSYEVSIKPKIGYRTEDKYYDDDTAGWVARYVEYDNCDVSAVISPYEDDDPSLNGSGTIVLSITNVDDGAYVRVSADKRIHRGMIIDFADSPSFMGLLSTNVSEFGGYAVVDHGTPSSATFLPIQLNLEGVVFKYDGKVYDTITLDFEDVSHGLGYIDDSGNAVKPWEMSNLNTQYHVWALMSVRFSNGGLSGDDVITVLEKVYDTHPFETGDDGNIYPPIVYLMNGRYRWTNPKATSILVLDDLGTTGDRYNHLYDSLTDYELLDYFSAFSSTGNLLNDTADWFTASYNPFNLISQALSTTASFMGITILPGLTIGICFTIPLLVGLVVLMFKLIKK